MATPAKKPNKLKDIKSLKIPAQNKKPNSGEKKPADPRQRARKILRGPLFWIVIALFAVSIIGRISGSGAQFIKVDTSTILAAISENKVNSAIVIDKDQKIEVILKSGTYIQG